MIAQIIITALIIFSYNFLLLTLPLIIFLISLKFPAVFDYFNWVYFPFIFFSPMIALILCNRLVASFTVPLGWTIPVATCLVGYAPILIIYFSLSSLSNPLNYILALTFPVTVGLVSYTSARFLSDHEAGIKFLAPQHNSVGNELP